jgi:hypothetical protein
MTEDEINNEIQNQLNFLSERPSGLLYLPNRCYIKIAKLIDVDYNSLNKTQKQIFKEYCFSNRVYFGLDLTRFGINKIKK